MSQMYYEKKNWYAGVLLLGIKHNRIVFFKFLLSSKCHLYQDNIHVIHIQWNTFSVNVFGAMIDSNEAWQMFCANTSKNVLSA